MLWRGLTQLQVGTDPRWSAAVDDLSPTAARALAGLPAGSDVRVLRARLAASGTAAQEVEDLVGHLHRAALLVEAAEPTPTTPDDLAWSLVAGAGAVRAARRSRTVRVDGLGRVGLRVAGALATAGVGVLDLVDAGRVGPGDVEAGGYGTQDVGSSRVAAAARILHDAVPTVRLTRPAQHPSLVVLVEQHVADPARHRALLDNDVPHLSVVLREAAVLVGPLVLPGEGPCLRCDEFRGQTTCCG
nr:ThiF family adenylyltransferase [uncultured Actinotalea sp.]